MTLSGDTYHKLIHICQHTVAQKTVQVFACFGKIVLVQNADIIQGPDFLVTKIQHISLLKHFRSCDLNKNS